MTRIAIIGAGMAGLTLGRRLSNVADIHIFDKSRGVGGRMATRRTPPFEFDHGAQFFRARTPAFKALIQPLLNAGAIKPWLARFAEYHGKTLVSQRQWTKKSAHYVGVPNMNAVAKMLAHDLSITLETTIDHVRFANQQWALVTADDRQLTGYDWLIITAPPLQAQQLLRHTDQTQQQHPTMQACFSLMLGAEQAIDLPFDAALIKDANISWISVNHTKPGRPDTTSLLIHSTNRWADAHIDQDHTAARDYLFEHTQEILGADLGACSHRAIHGWRYANIAKQTGPSFDLQVSHQLALCGDYFIQGRIESAFTSADALATALRPHLSTPTEAPA